MSASFEVILWAGLSFVLAGSAAMGPSPRIVMLCAGATGAHTLPAGTFQAANLDDTKRTVTSADTVIVNGDSLPPRYLARSATDLARAIAAYHPHLIVLETSYGASAPLMQALVAEGSRATVVAAPFALGGHPFRYAVDFIASGDVTRQALAVQSDPPAPLLRWSLNEHDLMNVERQVNSVTGAVLAERVRLQNPPLVSVPLGSPIALDGEVLVPVKPERLKSS